MKLRTRLTSLLLSFSMLLTMLPISVFTAPMVYATSNGNNQGYEWSLGDLICANTTESYDDLVDGPTEDTVFTLEHPTYITAVRTIHSHLSSFEDFSWDGMVLSVKNLETGEITVLDSSGINADELGSEEYGTWNVFPRITLLPGTYQLIDPHPESWSCAPEGNGKGICEIKGLVDYFFACTISNAGPANQQTPDIVASWGENSNFENHFSFGNNLHYSDIVEYYVATEPDPEDLEEFGGSLHEVQLFSAYDLDLEKIALRDADGELVDTTFVETIRGFDENGSGLAYYTTGLVIPAEDVDYTLYYDDVCCRTFRFTHLPSEWHPDVPLVYTMVSCGYDRADGKLTGFRLKVSGMNLPEDPERYRLDAEVEETDQYYALITAVDGPDAYGNMILHCKPTGKGHGSWPILGITDGDEVHNLMFFEKGNVYKWDTGELNTSGIYWFTNVGGEIIGNRASIYKPYYVIETSAPKILKKPSVKVPASSETSTVAITLRPGDYENPQMAYSLDGGEAFTEWAPIPENRQLELDLDNGDYSIVFRFKADELPEFTTKAYPLTVSAPLPIRFTDIPAAYAGAKLTLSDGETEKAFILDESGSINIGEWQPGSYYYTVDGKSGHIASGAVTFTNRGDQKLELPALGTLTVSTDHKQAITRKELDDSGNWIEREAETAQEVVSATVLMTLKTPDGDIHKTSGALGTPITQLPEGTEVTATLDYDLNNYPEILGLKEESRSTTISGDSKLAFSFNLLKTAPVTGAVSRGAKSGSTFPQDSVAVTLTQEYERGGVKQLYTNSCISDSEGKFTLQAYEGIAAKVMFRFRSQYAEWEIPAEAAAADKTGKSVLLDKSSALTIPVKLTGKSLKQVDSDGQTLAEAEDIPLDSACLQILSITNGSRTFTPEQFTQSTAGGQLIVTIPQEIATDFDWASPITLQSSDSFEVNGIGYTLPVDGRTAEVQYDESGIAVAEFRAVPYTGKILATVSTEADSGRVGVLALLYDSVTTNKCQYVTGNGELELTFMEQYPYTNVQGAKATVYSFMVSQEELQDVVTMLDHDCRKFFKHAESGITASAFAVKELEKAQDGAFYRIGTMVPEKSHLSVIPEPYSFRYEINSLMNVGTTPAIHVTGVIQKRRPDTPDTELIRRITFMGESIDVAFNGQTDETWENAPGSMAKNYNTMSFSALIPVKGYNGNELDFSLLLEYGDSDSDETETQQFRVSERPDLFTLVTAKNTNTRHLDGWIYTFPAANEEEALVTIWDNGVPVTTYTPYDDHISRSNKSYVDIPVSGESQHVLWATRLYNGETITTKPVVLQLNPYDDYSGNLAISHIYWKIWNYKMTPVEEEHLFPTLWHMGQEGINIWPDNKSNMRFWLHNASPDEVETVRLVATYTDGTKHYFNSKPDLNTDRTPDMKHQNAYWWEIKGFVLGSVESIGYDVIFKKPTVDPEKAALQARTEAYEYIYKMDGMDEMEDELALAKDIAGIHPIQVEAWSEQANSELPEPFQNLDLVIKKNTDDEFVTELKAPTDDLAAYKVSMSKGGDSTTADIYNQMDAERETGKSALPGEEGYEVHWIEEETKQGRVYMRYATLNEKAADGTYHTVTRQSAYYPAEVAEYFEVLAQPGVSQSSAVSAGAIDTITGVGKSAFDAQYKVYEITSEVSSYGDLANTLYTGAVYQAELDITRDVIKAKEAAKGASFMSENFGNAMNILGVADTVYTYAKGPSGADPNLLRQALARVESESARRSLERQIKDYEDLRNAIFRQDMTMKTVSTASGFYSAAGFWTKLSMMVGGKINEKISDKSKELNKQVYNTTLADITRTIELENYKKKHAQDLANAEKAFIERIRSMYGDSYCTERFINEEKSFYVLQRDEDGVLRYMWKATAPKPNFYRDPSGYVFEGDESNRLEGVTAELYFSNSVDAEGKPTDFSLWADPNSRVDLRQKNPRSTGAEGEYAWGTPDGWWKVRYTKEGYSPVESVAMEVPPEHTAVNIGMLSTEAPAAAVKADDGKLYILFSKYMQLESLLKAKDYTAGSFDATDFAVTFTDSKGNKVDGTVSFPDIVQNTGYKGKGYTTVNIDSDYFVRTAVFTPEDSKISVSSLNAEFSEGIVSYAGVALDTAKEPEGIHLVRFDANGATYSIASAVTTDGRLNTLLNPTDDGYVFDGWYTKKNGGEKITTETEITGDMTLYAHWKLDENADFGPDPALNDLGLYLDDIPDQIFTGSAVTPFVQAYFNGIPLAADTDYKVSYKNNKAPGNKDSAAAPTVVVTGKGRFSGTASLTFTILAPEQNEGSIDLSAKKATTLKLLNADGTAFKSIAYGVDPTRAILPEVKLADGTQLVQGQDFTVTYSNMGKKGTGVALINGIGLYKGSLKKTFKITAKDLNTCSLHANIWGSPAFTQNKAKPAYYIKANGVRLIEGQDYTLTYTNNAAVGSVATVTIKGKGNYSGSVVLADDFVVEKGEFDISTMAVVAASVTKETAKPKVTVVERSTGKALKAGRDYTLDWLKDWDTTAHTVTVTGKGNYAEASITASYSVVPATAQIKTIALDKAKKEVYAPALQYSGSAVTLEPDWLIVKAGDGTVLNYNESQDPAVDGYYIVSYANNVAKGKATAYIRATGAYSGTKAFTYTISAKNVGGLFQWLSQLLGLKG